MRPFSVEQVETLNLAFGPTRCAERPLRVAFLRPDNSLQRGRILVMMGLFMNMRIYLESNLELTKRKENGA